MTTVSSSPNLLGRALRWVNSGRVAAFVYDDPLASHPIGNGKGTMTFYVDNSPRTTDIPLNRTSHERRMALLRILTQRTLCEKLFVWDLHSVMLRAYSPTTNLRKLQPNIIDLSFLAAWAGRQDMAIEDLLDTYKVDSLAALGEKLIRELPSDAMRYHDEHWKPMLQAYVPREMKPIEVVGSDGVRRSQYIHYVFAAGTTSRVSVKGGSFKDDADFFNPHNYPRVKRPNTIVARPGWKIVSIDMKSADVRTIASLARDKQLMGCLSDGKDPYGQVVDEVNLESLSRNAAKELTLAFFYGGEPNQLAKRVQLSTAEANRVYNTAYRLYGAAIKWAEGISESKEAFTPTGRLFWAGRASDARRKLPSYVTQSTTADICNEIFAAYLMRCKPDRSVPLLFLHDEFVIEVHDTYLEEELEFLQEIGERNPITSFGLEDLELRVEMQIGDTWR